MSLIQVSSKSKKKRKKNKGRTPLALFERQWRLVQQQIKRNEELRDELLALYQRVKAEIQDQEESLTSVVYLQTQKLLAFCKKKSLSNWHREELHGWVAQNIQFLNSHPFSGHLDLEILKKEFLGLFPDDEDEEFLGKFESDSTKDDAAEDAYGKTEDMFGNLEEDEYDEYTEEEILEDKAFFDELFGTFNNDDESNYSEYEEKMHEEAKELNQLLKGSPINKMFRRIAKVIHPDKELDPARKEEKHLLMSGLIQAREQKDIIRIFSLYSEHVGEAPLDIIGGDIDKITKLLKYQVNNLNIEHEKILFENPMHYMIYNKFYAKSKQGVTKNIKHHLKSLREEIQNHQNITSDLSSLKALKPYLNDRYEDSVISMAVFGLKGVPF